VVVLILIAGGYIFNVSQKAAHQTSPTAAVDAFLDAALHAHNLDLAEGYTCGSEDINRITKSTIDQIRSYEKAHPDTSVSYLWSNPTQKSRSGNHTTVTSDITARTIINGATTDAPAQTWTFDVRNKGGWKVCSVTMA
jgi:hypothetical protein